MPPHYKPLHDLIPISRPLHRLDLPFFQTPLVERTAYREMFLTGAPVSVIEEGKGAGLEIEALIAEIQATLKRHLAGTGSRRKKAMA